MQEMGEARITIGKPGSRSEEEEEVIREIERRGTEKYENNEGNETDV